MDNFGSGHFADYVRVKLGIEECWSAGTAVFFALSIEVLRTEIRRYHLLSSTPNLPDAIRIFDNIPHTLWQTLFTWFILFILHILFFGLLFYINTNYMAQVAASGVF